jgi:hypothetical protein
MPRQPGLPVKANASDLRSRTALDPDAVQRAPARDKVIRP